MSDPTVRTAYGKLSEDERLETLRELMEGWSEDWEDKLGQRPDGSIVWQVSAVDVMLLVQEIYRLRIAASIS